MGKSDLNALSIQDMRLLLSLEKEGTVSYAANLLGISQSSASYGLEKLRRAFADPLFIRQGAGMTPTMRGRNVTAYSAEMLRRLETLMEPEVFDPTTSRRVFRVAATGYEIHALLAKAHVRLRRQAPHVTLRVEDINAQNVVETLHRTWDILLSPKPPEASGVRHRTLFKDQYFTFFDPEYQNAPETPEAFAAAPHAIVSHGRSVRTNVDHALEALGLSRNVVLIASSFDHLSALMRGTPLISTLPGRFANGLFGGFEQIAAPLPMSELELHMVWSEVRSADAGHDWLRKLLVEHSE